MKIILSEINNHLVNSWLNYLPQINLDCIEVKNCNILSLKVDAVVSPANSFGFMDGGIDLLYTHFFGIELQNNLQKIIQEQFNGELLVGQAVGILTNNEQIPYCISAPTMRTPQRLFSFEPVYLSTKAAVKCALDLNLESIAISGMGTGTGGLDLQKAAETMILAIKDTLNPPKFPKSLSEVKPIN